MMTAERNDVRDVTPRHLLKKQHQRNTESGRQKRIELERQLKLAELKQKREEAERKISLLNKEIDGLNISQFNGNAKLLKQATEARIKVLKSWQQSWDYFDMRIKSHGGK